MAQLETEKQATIEEINDVNAVQSKNIEELREEVIRLRNDLLRADEYYSTAMRFVSMLIVIFCTSQAFQKKDSDISTDDLTKLNLSQ